MQSDAPATGDETVVVPSTEANEVPVQPRVLPPDPLELAAKTVNEIPSLRSVQKELETIYICSVQYVGTADTPPVAKGLKPEQALDELHLAQNWSSQTIEDACKAVMEQLADVWQDLNDRYHTETEDQGTATSKPVELDDLSARLSSEQDEQASLMRNSHDLLATITTIRNKLGLQAPPTENVQTGTATQDDEPEHGSILHSLRSFGGNVRGALLRDAEDEPKLIPRISVPLPEAASWLTAPILTDDNMDVQRLTGLIATRARNAEDAEYAWSALKALGLTQEAVVSLINNVEDLAKRQIKQSDTIQKEVNRSYGAFRHEIEINQRIRVLVLNVSNFFFPR